MPTKNHTKRARQLAMSYINKVIKIWNKSSHLNYKKKYFNLYVCKLDWIFGHRINDYARINTKNCRVIIHSRMSTRKLRWAVVELLFLNGLNFERDDFLCAANDYRDQLKQFILTETSLRIDDITNTYGPSHSGAQTVAIQRYSLLTSTYRKVRLGFILFTPNEKQ
eukprot:392511_1